MIIVSGIKLRTQDRLSDLIEIIIQRFDNVAFLRNKETMRRPLQHNLLTLMAAIMGIEKK